MNVQLLNNMKYVLLIILCTFCHCFSQENTFFNIARKGTVEEARQWISEKPNSINEINQHGFSPLILACYSGNIEMVTFLIDNNANVDFLSSEGTALMAATVKGNLKMTELLLKSGANPDLTNEAGISALMYANKLKNISIVKLLLLHNANKLLLDKEGKSAFEYAVFTKNEEIINLLK